MKEREREMLTHIPITMWCQWSVCEVSCCLVTVLQQQRQCLCLYVSSSQWWVSARLSHCCRRVCCLQTILLLTRQRTFIHGRSYRRRDRLAAYSAPDWRRHWRRRSSGAQLVLGSQRAPRMSCVHWPRCPVVTPPINHHWLTAPAMAPALRKGESSFSPPSG